MTWGEQLQIITKLIELRKEQKKITQSDADNYSAHSKLTRNILKELDKLVDYYDKLEE